MARPASPKSRARKAVASGYGSDALNDFTRSTWPLVREKIKQSLSLLPIHRRLAGRILAQTDAPGSRIRPYVSVGAGRILGAADGLLVPFAALVEILHTATLIHDDIEDGSEYRRGAPSLWKKFSAGEAVFLGDCAFLAAYRMIESLDADDAKKLALLRLVNRKAARLVEGQLFDIEHRSSPGTPAMYERIAAGKSGSLFGLALGGPMILAGARPSGSGEDLEDFERRFGTLYQIRDDVLDLLGGKEGRRPGDDLASGNVTIFNHLPSASLSPNERSKFAGLVARCRKEGGGEAIRELRDFIFKTKIMESVEAMFTARRDRLLESELMTRPPRLRDFFSGVIAELHKTFRGKPAR